MFRLILLIISSLSLLSCSSVKNDAGKRFSIGRDTGIEMIYKDQNKSFYYSEDQNETSSFQQAADTITAAIISAATAMGGTKVIEDITNQ